MTGRHRIPDLWTPGEGRWRATAIVQANTGWRVCDLASTRHDGSQQRQDQPAEQDQ